MIIYPEDCNSALKGQKQKDKAAPFFRCLESPGALQG